MKVPSLHSLIISLVVIIPIIFLAGCNGKNGDGGGGIDISQSQGKETYIPKIQLSLSTKDVTVKNGSVSDTLITAEIEKVDNKNIQTSFTLLLEPSDPDYVYAIIKGENKPSIDTKSLYYSGEKDTISFKVYGRILGNQPYSPYTITLKIIYNDNPIPLETEVLNVKVVK